MVGSDGAELSYYGCTVSIPNGALEEDTEISLEIISTDLNVVSPVLKLEPSNLNFKCPVKVNLPVVVYPCRTIPEAEWPELILMCRENGKWSNIKSTMFNFTDLTFECNHFSVYYWKIGSNGKGKWMKRLACFLYKGVQQKRAMMAVSICDDLPDVIKVSKCIMSLHVQVNLIQTKVSSMKL